MTTSKPILSPSSSHRWMQCPASAWYVAPWQQSDAAREGSAAHALAERCLTEGSTPESYLFDTIYDGVEVDFTMVDGVNAYLSHIGSLEAGWSGVEAKFRIPVIGRTGTVDWWGVNGLDVHVVDLKYGFGPVSAIENPQLMLYALAVDAHIKDDVVKMVIDRRTGTPGAKPAVTTFYLHIVQPRVFERPSVWEISRKDLVRWSVKTLMPAIERVTNEPDTHIPGEHCRYCPAGIACPGVQSLIEEIDIVKDPGTMTTEQLAAALDQAQALKSWAKQVEAEAMRVLETDNAIPGWKLVEGRGRRDWRPGSREHVEAVLEEDAYLKTLVSPAQAEKMLGKKEFKAVLGAEVTKTPGRPTLAKANDGRAEVKMNKGEGL